MSLGPLQKVYFTRTEGGVIFFFLQTCSETNSIVLYQML